MTSFTYPKLKVNSKTGGTQTIHKFNYGKFGNNINSVIDSLKYKPATPAQPVAKPAAPTPPPVAPAPVNDPGGLSPDEQYINQAGGINTALANKLTGINNQRAATQYSYGIDDPTNPFSQMSLLKQKYADAHRNNTNSYANQGHLYSGALQNQQNYADQGQLQDTSALNSNYQSALNDLTSQQTSAQDQANADLIAAEQALRDRALANRPDAAPPTAPTPVISGNNNALFAKTLAQLRQAPTPPKYALKGLNIPQIVKGASAALKQKGKR